VDLVACRPQLVAGGRLRQRVGQFAHRRVDGVPVRLDRIAHGAHVLVLLEHFVQLVEDRLAAREAGEAGNRSRDRFRRGRRLLGRPGAVRVGFEVYEVAVDLVCRRPFLDRAQHWPERLVVENAAVH
jgi:hypothetical protein